jgi:hypothetical protein
MSNHVTTMRRDFETNALRCIEASLSLVFGNCPYQRRRCRLVEVCSIVGCEFTEGTSRRVDQRAILRQHLGVKLSL